MDTALPLYINPHPGDPNWARAIRAGGSRIGFIIANIANGPGDHRNPDWTRVLNDCAASGIPVYGYIFTRYGARQAAQVDSEIQSWLALYPQLSGFYLDETATELEHLGYYSARYNLIKTLNPNFTVAINPRAITPEAYMAVCDVNTVFQSDYQAWLSQSFPAWMSNYPESRFYAIIYGVPGEPEMEQVINQAASQRIGKIFVTDQNSPSHPLPAWFETELAQIQRQRIGPPPLKLVIENVATSVTRGSAAISWQTSLRATGIVVYGTSPSLLTLQVQQSTPSTGHWINIGNLDRKTTYYYQIIARTADGSALASSIFSFRTMP